ncbi:hypothetical protein [Nostoc sp. FACHB-133]|uniref:hypothetical protein n=1 Tax=Nostoc sp. FACHB-133 TaxID=2692835 RepID=UPI0016895D45|nr:hypothetical protein [Nostoc sp. FACHB-133]MBD2527499.1 hypothetical protein [Nostoc sp. FACHB-133]
MAHFNREIILNGSSIPKLSEAWTRLSEAHQILVLHTESFASEDENPLEHTKIAMELLQKLLNQPR